MMKERTKENAENLTRKLENCGKIFDVLPQGVVLLDSRCRVIYANASASRILGVEVERLKGSDFLDSRWRAVHEDGTPFTQGDHLGRAVLRSGQKTDGVVMGLQDAQGQRTRWIEVEFSPQILDDSEESKGILAVFSDITDQRESRKSFHDILARLRRSQEIALVGDWNWDVPRDLFSASDEAKRQMGFPADYSPCFQDIADCIHPEDRREAGEKLRQAMRTGNPYTTEFRIFRKVTGELRHIVSMGEVELDGQGNPVRVFGINQDITERKTAEEALRRSEEKYRLIFDYSPLGVFYFDESGAVVACNDRFVEILGSSREKLIGLSLLSLPNPKLVAEIQKTIAGGVGSYEGIYQAVTSGKKTPLRAVFAPVMKGGVLGGSIGIIEDISERWNAEEAFRESEMRLRTLSDNLPGGMVYEVEYGGAAKERRFNYLSAGVESLHGVKAEDVLGDPGLIYRQILTEDRQRVMEEEEEALKGLRPFKAEFRCRLPDGRVEWHLVSSAPRRLPNGFVVWDGIEVDITERKVMDEMLRESEVRYRELFELSVDGIVILSSEKIIREVNNAFCDMLGVRKEDVLGKGALELTFDAESVRKAPFRFRDVERGERVEVQRVLVRPDGRRVHVDMRTKKMPDGNFQTVFRDITEQQAAQEALRDSEQLLSSVFDAVNDGYWDWNVLTGQTYFSSRYYTMLGYDMGDFPAGFESWQKLIHPEDRQRVKDAVMAHVEQRDPGYSVDFRMLAKNGEYRWILGRGQVVERNEEGIVVRMVGTHTDITDRKVAEAALRESEEKYRLVFDYSPLGLIYFDTQGIILACNDRFVDIIGSSRNRLVGLSMLSLPDEKVVAAVRKALDGGTGLFDGVYASVTAEKKTPLRAVFTAAVREGVCLGGIGIIEDISDRKAAEENIRQSEARFRELFELAGDGILLGDHEGVVIGANRAFCEMAGLNGEDFLGKPIHQLPFDPEIQRKVPFRFDLLQQGQTVDSRRILIRPDGERVYVDMRTKMMPDGTYQAIFRNISQNIASEEALRESEERYRSFLSQISEGIYRFEIEPPMPVSLPLEEQIDYFYDHSRMAECNASYMRMYGFTDPGQVIGKSLLDFHGGRDNEKNRQLALKQIQSGYCVNNAVSEEKDAQGRTKYFRNNSLGIVENGQVLRFWGTQVDITDQVEAEREREKLQLQLQQAQKMESVGRLAGGVAHDFNNMLGVILGYIEMSLAKIEPDHPLAGYMHQIRRAAERSSNLTRQLLAFARKQPVLPKVVDLNHMVEGMLNMLARLIGEDIDLVWLPGEGLGSVRIDPTQLDQVLANLCVNAKDSISGTGRITIETGSARIDDINTVIHPEARPGEYLRLTVSDNGCGMDRETQMQIFEPFFTTKETGKGTGLGLATVYGIVRQNEGFITVYSELGKGSSFKIYFPVCREKAEAPVKPPEKVEFHERRQETILLVEDEPAILEMTVLMLRELGYNVLSAATPGQAVEQAQNCPKPIDLLITDVVMPEMNGRDLAGKLLEIHPKMKRLFMSGYTADVIAYHGVLDQGVNFMQKPFTISELSAKVREVLYNE